jgi:hypothetical protein
MSNNTSKNILNFHLHETSTSSFTSISSLDFTIMAQHTYTTPGYPRVYINTVIRLSNVQIGFYRSFTKRAEPCN